MLPHGDRVHLVPFDAPVSLGPHKTKTWTMELRREAPGIMHQWTRWTRLREAASTSTSGRGIGRNNQLVTRDELEFPFVDELRPLACRWTQGSLRGTCPA